MRTEVTTVDEELEVFNGCAVSITGGELTVIDESDLVIKVYSPAEWDNVNVVADD